MGMDRQPPHGRLGSGGSTEVPAPSACGNPPAARITLEAEVPEVLFRGMRAFLETHPHWDQYSLISSALAGFLFQHGCQDPQVAKRYLDGLFQIPSSAKGLG
jgi:hypothetical protein